jgi:hypothetical protein
MRVVDLYWIISPMVHGDHHEVPWMYIAASAGLSGIWFWAFLAQLRRRPVVPVGDPHLEEAVLHVGH